MRRLWVRSTAESACLFGGSRERWGQGRLAWVDDAKGVGIVLVVVGHAYSGLIVDGIYLFHMPLFFFLAGVVFRPSTLGGYVSRRAQGLLLPYVAFMATLVLIKAGLALRGGEPLVAEMAAQARSMTSYLFGGRALTGDLGVMWFVTCLFLATVVYEGLRLRLGEPTSRLFVVAMTVILAVAYPLAPLSLPWDASVVPMALVFVWMGEVWWRFEHAVPAGFRSYLGAPANLAWLAGAATLAILGLVFAEPFDMKFGIYGTPVLSVIAAAGCIHVVVICCWGLSRFAWFNRLFAPLGRASLVIFFLHRFFILHLQDDLPSWGGLAVALMAPFAVFAALRAAPPAAQRAFLGSAKQ